MSNLNSYNILINRFKAFAEGHLLLKNFTYGAITLADLQKFGLYPFMHIVPVDVSYESGVKNFSFDIFFADLPRDEESKAEYQKETLSDLQQIAEDLLGEITNHRVIFGRDVSVLSSRLVPFEEEFSNVLTGWNLSITLQIPYNWSACETPATFNDYIVYNQSTGESTILEFKDSIVREGGEVRLVNDVEFPSESYYYGTDENGVRGWFAFPSDEVGLTCETLASCSTITDIQTNIGNLETDVEDISANVVDIQMDITTIEGNITTLQTDVLDLETEVGLKANTSDISAVGFSNNYNDLDNLPNIPDSTSDLINDSGFITINDVPTSISILSHEVKLGSAMTKGTPVYVSSADGTNMIVSPASNGSEATSSKTLGLLMEGGNNNAKVDVITEGILAGLDTSTATIGDAVWLGSTGTLIYGLANKPVAPLHLVFIGIVTRVNINNGEIFVKVQNGFELDEIHNVATAQSKTTPVDADAVLLYDSADANGLWKKLSWSNIKATLKTYFDSLYASSNQSNIDKGKRMVSFFTDFLANNALDGLGSFQSGGTIGTLGGSQILQRTNQQGVISYNTSTLATNYVHHCSTQGIAQLWFGNGIWNYETSINILNLSTSLERYRLIFGFGAGSGNSTELDGLFFTYDEGGTANGTIASANWQCVSVQSGIRTLTTTTTPVVANAYIKLRIEINATGTSASFYVNGILIATHTTNIPTGTNNRYVLMKQGIAKTIGTTSRVVHCDYIGYENIQTTPRV